MVSAFIILHEKYGGEILVNVNDITNIYSYQYPYQEGGDSETKIVTNCKEITVEESYECVKDSLLSNNYILELIDELD